MDDYKQHNTHAYNLYSKIYDQKFKVFFMERVKKVADIFLKEIKGKKIVDLGCGPGNHAEYFQKHGLDVLCVDSAKGMLEHCKEKGLKVMHADLEDVSFPKHTFDGVWAFTSLIHIPKKNILPVVQRIVDMLKPNGLFGLSVKEGTTEGYETRESYPGTKKYVTYFTDKEIRQLFGKDFDIIFSNRNYKDDKHIFLNYVMRLKN